MNYFGTDLTSRGHYLFEIEGNGVYRSRLQLEKLPFNPEGLPYKKHNNGDVGFYNAFGLTILAICGSCKDERPGSKSVFWVEGSFTQEEMKEKILSIPVGAEMIKRMKFTVNW